MTQTFVDTLYMIAVVNQRDQYHEQALELLELYADQPLLTTDAVLLEVGNALARGHKAEAVRLMEGAFISEDLQVVRLAPELFDKAFDLYRPHQDKEWGLVDCVSFVVMREAGVTDALTFDRHFAQAGFRPLLRGRN